MEELIRQYGYLAILVGAVLEGETVVLLGGFAAHQGYLNVVLTGVAAFIGTFTGDQFFFYLGRHRGRSYLERRPAWRANIDRVSRFIRTNETLLMMTYRYLYGIRTLTPFALGAANVSRIKFLCFSLIGALLWSITVVAAGYFFGRLLTRWLGELKDHELDIALAVLGVSATFWLARFLRNRRIGHRLQQPP